MKKVLAKELQNYYTRKGNRIVFSNGMSLNQFALEMWERLGCKGVDASVLSRVLRGERLFTPPQLAVFCKILNISKLNEEKLERCLYKVVKARYGFDHSSLSMNASLIELIEDNLDKIQTARLGDYPSLAAAWAEKLYKTIKLELSRQDEETNIHLTRLLAKLIKEKVRSNLGTSKASDLGIKVTPAATELKLLANQLRDTSLLGLSYSYRGTVKYVYKNYKESISLYNKALKLLTSKEDRIFPLRTIALCYAYQKDEAGFNMAKVAAIKTGRNLSLNEQCQLYEGLARGEAILGNEKNSRSYLDKARRLEDKLWLVDGEYKVARKIQIARTDIEISKIAKKGKRRKKVEKLGKETLNLSKCFGYSTYTEKVSNLLEGFV